MLVKFTGFLAALCPSGAPPARHDTALESRAFPVYRAANAGCGADAIRCAYTGVSQS